MSHRPTRRSLLASGAGAALWAGVSLPLGARRASAALAVGPAPGAPRARACIRRAAPSSA